MVLQEEHLTGALQELGERQEKLPAAVGVSRLLPSCCVGWSWEHRPLWDFLVVGRTSLMFPDGPR